MSGRFVALGHRLLSAGVAPRHVYRYLRELEDHFADLLQESGDEAAACARLGTDDDLAAAMLAYPEVRSWTARAPWAILLAGPATLLALGGLLVVLVSLAGSMTYSSDILRLEDASWLPPRWLLPLVPAMTAIEQFALPVLLGWGVALIALRQRSSPAWPTAGLVSIASLGAAIVALHHAGWIVSLQFPSGADHVARFAMTAENFNASRTPLDGGGRWSFHLSFYESSMTPMLWFGSAWLANLLLMLPPYWLACAYGFTLPKRG